MRQKRFIIAVGTQLIAVWNANKVTGLLIGSSVDVRNKMLILISSNNSNIKRTINCFISNILKPGLYFSCLVGCENLKTLIDL